MPIDLKRDIELRDRCAAGEAEATEALVREYSGLVYHAIQHVLRLRQVAFQRDDLEDLHNTVFLQLFDNRCSRLRQYRGKNGCSLASWIRLIAVRTVLNHLRKKSLYSMDGPRQLLPLEEVRELQDHREGPWALLQKSEQMAVMEKGIARLPSRDRLFFRLYFEKGLSLNEVAETLQISLQNIHTVKHRAVKKLKSYVKEAMRA